MTIKLAKDRMFSYGPEGFESELLDKFGIKVEPHGFDDHYYWIIIIHSGQSS